MNLLKKFLVILIIAGILAAAGAVSAAETTPLPPQSKKIRDVLVPVPAEIFGSLDKFANSNWRRVQRPELTHWKSRGDQAQIALLLGAVIAEGFIAVEAKDSLEVKEIGARVRTLGRALGVEQMVMRRSKSIVEYAEKEQWKAVREEWDSVLPDVQKGMKDLRSEDLAQLVSLGGWLRGTEALAALILQNYSDEAAAMLHQPDLLSTFETQIADLGGRIRKRPIVVTMEKGMQRVRPIVARERDPISKNDVTEVAKICADLLNRLKGSS